MSNLVSAAEFKAITPVSLPDTDLALVIERVEAELTTAIGAPYASDLELTETVPGIGANLFVKRPISAIVTVTEYDSWIAAEATATALTADVDYVLWPDQGRLARMNTRSTWDVKTIIVYTPRDDRKARQGVIIDLVRLDLARQAFRSENVGGAYSYQAPPDWEQARRQIMRRLMFTRV